MEDNAGPDGFDASWQTADYSETEDDLVTETNLKRTTDKNVYGQQLNVKVATVGDLIR